MNFVVQAGESTDASSAEKRQPHTYIGLRKAETEKHEESNHFNEESFEKEATNYQGDGRKREAKINKSQAVVTQDEVALEEAITQF